MSNLNSFNDWLQKEIITGHAPKCSTCGDKGEVARHIGPGKSGMGEFKLEPCPKCGISKKKSMGKSYLEKYD